MANESEFPKSDGDILYASEANLLAPSTQGNFTITNAAYDNDYVDVSISAADYSSGDVLEIDVWGIGTCGVGNSGQLTMKVELNNLTTPIDLTEVTGPSLTSSITGTLHAKYLIKGIPSSQFLINTTKKESRITGGAMDTIVDEILYQDTGESNPLSSAFTIRINGKTTNTVSHTLYYTIKKIKNIIA